MKEQSSLTWRVPVDDLLVRLAGGGEPHGGGKGGKGHSLSLSAQEEHLRTVITSSFFLSPNSSLSLSRHSLSLSLPLPQTLPSLSLAERANELQPCVGERGDVQQPQRSEEEVLYLSVPPLYGPTNTGFLPALLFCRGKSSEYTPTNK